jgi:hypothetical protein
LAALPAQDTEQIQKQTNKQTNKTNKQTKKKKQTLQIEKQKQ